MEEAIRGTQRRGDSRCPLCDRMREGGGAGKGVYRTEKNQSYNPLGGGVMGDGLDRECQNAGAQEMQNENELSRK